MAETASLAMEDLDPDRLLRDWTLTDADRAEVARARGPESRLWTALHLCNLRHTGRFLGLM
jgi:hypothetical protein